MVVVVVVMVVVVVIVVEVVLFVADHGDHGGGVNYDNKYVDKHKDDISKRSQGLGVIMTIPSIPIMAPINPPLTSQSSQPEIILVPIPSW